MTEITPPSLPKPYLGGYRNVHTDQIYHHATAQTFQPAWKYKSIERFDRCTQTAVMKNKLQQTPEDRWVQANVPLLYLYPTEEKVLQPSGCYVSADEIKQKQFEAILIIQKNYRRWTAQRLLNRLRDERNKCIEWDGEQDQLREQDLELWFKELQHRMKNPSSKDDFVLLFSELQKWWNHEAEELAENSSGAKLKTSLWMLLLKEIDKMQDIEKQRQKVQETVNDDKRDKFLVKASEPKLWKACHKPIPVETASTNTARFLKDMYITISKPKLHVEDRIAALRQLVESVKVYSGSLTDSLTSLANREIDLLLRGAKEKNLEGLRSRIRNLVWQLVRQPAINPEAQRLSKLHPVNGKFPYIKLCSSCGQHFILPPNTLDEAANCVVIQERFVRCESCKYLANEGWMRKDFEVYKRMLKLLCTEEEKKKCSSGIIYLLRTTDICLMVEKIWKSQSCISGSIILEDLEFARWNVLENWTPWNCILVTRIEAVHHTRLQDHEKIYDSQFCQTVNTKHIEARRYFSTIPRFQPYLRTNEM